MKTAVLFAPGYEEIEALTPVDVLYRADIACDKISITDKHAVTSSHNVTVTCDYTYEQVDIDSYDMIILPGGLPGTTHLKEYQPLRDAIMRRAQENKYLAAICAAPSVFADLGILQGRRATSHPSFQDVLRQQGADVVQDNVVVDGHIITSKGAGTALDFALTILGILENGESVEKVKNAMVYESSIC